MQLSAPYDWMPDSGSIEGIVGAAGQHIIHQTLQWSVNDPLSFDFNYAFEHDLKLYDDQAPQGYGGVAGVGQIDKWPDCLPGGNFWVQRGTDMYWSTNYPDAAGPYLDTHWEDPCTELDLSIGAYSPEELSRGVEYHTYVTDPTPEGIGGSEFHVGVSSLWNDCAGAGEEFCVGLGDDTTDEKQPLIQRCTAQTLPGRFTWTAAGSPDSNACYRQRVRDDNPTGYWRLDDLYGTSAEAALGPDGEYKSSVQLGVPGATREESPGTEVSTSAPDRAIRLGGSGWVAIPHYTTLNSDHLTVEAWVRTRRTGSYQSFIVNRDTYTLAVNSGKAQALMTIRSGTSVGGYTLNGTTPLNDGAWHHLAVTYDGATAKLFVDGKQEPGAGAQVAKVGSIEPITRSVGIGAAGAGSSAGAFVGDVDEVAIYDKALTQTDFAERFSRRWKRPPHCYPTTSYSTLICDASPTSYWRFGNPAGSNLVDFTGLSDGIPRPGIVQGAAGAISGETDGGIRVDGATTGSAYVRVPYEPYGSYALMEKFTFEAWIRTTRQAYYPAYIVYGGGYEFFVTGTGKLRALMTIQNGSSVGQIGIEENTVVNDGAWHHLALTYDGDRLKLFVDGQMKQEVLKTGRLWPAIGEDLMIGGVGSASNVWIGGLDEVAIYDHAVGAPKISARWNAR